MRASLIEIDLNPPRDAWYSQYPGRRLWCQAEIQLNGDREWIVLPGQGLDRQYVTLVILPEHGWVVREGEVELVLREVAPEAQQITADL